MKALEAVFVLAALFAGVLQAQQPDREEFLRQFPWRNANSTPSDAMLLRILVGSTGAKRGVEVGTNTGFGAINMGIAFERNGGRLTSIEINPKTAEAARQNLQKAGLDKIVTVIQGDALKVLPTIEGPIDFVYIDAAKPQYFQYLKSLEPKLKAGAVVVADNVIDYAKPMSDFLEYIQSSPLYNTVVIHSFLRASAEPVEGRSHGTTDGMLVGYKLK